MKYIMYSIYDKDLEEWTPPFIARSDAHAVKMIKPLIRDGSFDQESCDLFIIANYDNESVGVPVENCNYAKKVELSMVSEEKLEVIE